MKKSSLSFYLLALVLVSSQPLLAASSVTPFGPSVVFPGLLAMFWLSYWRRHKPIGGWLFYFYLQTYVGMAAASVAYFDRILPLLRYGHWLTQSATAFYALRSVLFLVMNAAQVFVATILLKRRSWILVSILRGVLFASLLAAISVVTIDLIYWPLSVPATLMAAPWPLVWLAYFSYSKRVEKVFKTKDWPFEEPAFIGLSITSDANETPARLVQEDRREEPGSGT